MGKSSKIRRNDLCPCGSGRKFKHCCDGEVDWRSIQASGTDPRPYLSTRGRNIGFLESMAEVLQLDSLTSSLPNLKKAFTGGSVSTIHEAVLKWWPPETNIDQILRRNSKEVRGLYVGQYQPELLVKGIVRHSIYSNKLMVVDPFVYPLAVQDAFNPILNPEQYRTQTLKNFNLWIALYPWIREGIVEVIRTPDDFDPELKWNAMVRQTKKYEENEELSRAAEESAAEMLSRYREELISLRLLSAPNTYLKKFFHESGLDESGVSFDAFIADIDRRRARDPNFLAPLGPDGLSSQLHMFSTGANYEIARLTSNLSGSHLVTDVAVKWLEIELDRKQHQVSNAEWEPFAKAFQEVQFKHLDNVGLDDALVIRQKDHLHSMRTFLRRVWSSASADAPFDTANSRILADELRHEVAEAEAEWRAIDRELLKRVGSQFASGTLAAGPLIASGYGTFVAAAVATAGAVNLMISRSMRKSFMSRFPAAFFLGVGN